MGKAQILMPVIIFIAVIFIVGLLIFLRLVFENYSEKPVLGPLENVSENEFQNNESALVNESLFANETNLTEESNLTDMQTNETALEEDVMLPLKIKGDDLRESDGGYFCNETASPVHKIRLYTYKTIEGVKVLSENYTESGEIKNVCSNYPYINVSVQNIRYNIRWEWQAVSEINGYRIYQYYYLESDNITREYDYYVELSYQATKLMDEGMDLWTKKH